MEIALKDVQNHVIKVSKSSFSCIFNEPLVHQVVTAYNTTSRQGTKAQKSRAQVSGSGKKPWRQKGTGRARAGSIRSPIWRSGGVTFAARCKDYTQKVNKKMYKNSLKSILSELIRQNRLLVFDKFCISLPKTKLLVQKLKKHFLKDVLIITNKLDKNLILAARNLYKVDVLTINKINPVSLIAFKNVIITVEAIKTIEELLS